MKYLVRSVKYFFYLAIVLTLVIAALMYFKIVEADIESVFRDGYASLWKIAGIIAVFAAVYPKVGFGKYRAVVSGSHEDLRESIAAFMQGRGYVLEAEEGQKGEEIMKFRLRSPLYRLTRMAEDRVTLCKTMSGYEFEGPTKDVVRLVNGLERYLRTNED